MLHEFFSKIGIYWAKHQYMPHGINWIFDLRRIIHKIDAPIVFDIGANVGQTTSEILNLFPNAAIHAFEPVGATFETLQNRFGAKLGIQCNRLAVSDSCGQGTIFSSTDSQLSHLVNPSEYPPQGDSRLEIVKTTSIEVYCVNKGINHIDILKTDTEGHDLAVLRGAGPLLHAGCIDWVLVEVTFDPLDEGHSQFREVDSLMMQCGMEVYCFYDHHFKGGERHHLFCNVLFVRKGLR